MSAPFSAGSEGSTWGSSGPGCECSGNASPMSSAAASLPATGRGCRSTPTCPACGRPMWRRSMCSAEGSPARTSASPGRGPGSTAPARVFGQSTPVLLASFDPATSSWRTSQLCLDGALDEFSGTWPRSGSMQSGIAYQRAPLAPLTGGIAFGLLPTPAATEYGSSQNGINGKGGRFERPSAGTPSLATMARKGLLPTRVPTPTAGDARGSGSRNLPGSKAHPGVSLTDYVKSGTSTTPRTWATPSVSDALGGPMNPQDRLDQGQQLNLKEQVWMGGGGGSLNPTWVEWLMGFPLGWTDLGASVTRSSRRSRNGSESAS
jgi:hypothetical protein